MTSTTDNFRPASLDDVIGQQAVVAELRVALEASAVRGDMPGHMLFVGPAGTGKTTLSLIIAGAVHGRLVQVMGPSVRSFQRDLFPLLLNARPRDVIFIDEIHRVARNVQEALFGVMEDGKLQDGNLTVGLPPLTIVGATTDPERLLTPMLDRFTRILRLVPYSPLELSIIVKRAAIKLGCALDDPAAVAIGEAARGVPRVALRMMLASRDYAYAEIPPTPAWKVAQGVTIAKANVEQALSSTAYEWRMTGRTASE